MTEYDPPVIAPVQIQVRVRYRKDRAAWQMSYRDPRSGKLVSRKAGSEQELAETAAATWQAELNKKEWPENAVNRRPRKAYRPPVTAEEFARMIGAVPLVVGKEYAVEWIRFLRALWSGVRIQPAFESHSLNHRLLTMTLANVQRVISEIGRAAEIPGGRVTSHDLHRENSVLIDSHETSRTLMTPSQ